MYIHNEVVGDSVAKRSICCRYKGSSIDFQMDGMADKERIKGKDKKMLQKLTRNRLKRALDKECRLTM